MSRRWDSMESESMAALHSKPDQTNLQRINLVYDKPSSRTMRDRSFFSQSQANTESKNPRPIGLRPSASSVASLCRITYPVTGLATERLRARMRVCGLSLNCSGNGLLLLVRLAGWIDGDGLPCDDDDKRRVLAATRWLEF